MKFSMPLLFVLLTAVACDRCEEANCANESTCFEGNCKCRRGFSGDQCQYEDKCLSGKIVCENGGRCRDEECECAYWYTGKECKLKKLDIWIADYPGRRTCDGNEEFALVRLKRYAPEVVENKLFLEMEGKKYIIVFENHYEFSIPAQEYGADTSISGSGRMSDGWKLEFQYTLKEISPNWETFATCDFRAAWSPQ